MTGVEMALIYWGYRLIRHLSDSSTSRSISTTAAAKPTAAKRPEKVVTLIGKTGAGKSSLGNALLGRASFAVGVEHGTTVGISEVEHAEGYRLRDTPGLLDDVDYAGVIWPALEDSSLVVYTTNGQLYRHELEVVERISTRQRLWDASNATPGRRRLAVFVNFGDVKTHVMTDSDRLRESVSVISQVSTWVPRERVVFGSASPSLAGQKRPPQVEELRSLIRGDFLTF